MHGQFKGDNNDVKMTVESTVPGMPATTASESKIIGFANKRLNREWKTMEAMIRIHCRDHHAPMSEIAENAGSYWITPPCDWNAAGFAWKNQRTRIARFTVINALAANRSRG